MRDILLFTLDDLGEGRGYVIAIFAIVLFAISCVLIRDAYAWFEGLSAPAEDDELDLVDVLEEEVEADPGLQAPAFATAPHQGFGRRHREAA